MKKMSLTLILLAIIVAASLISYITLATTSFSALQDNAAAFRNNMEFYDTAPFAVNISTNSTGSAYNVSIYQNNTFVAWLFNLSTSPYSARNRTALIWTAIGMDSPVRDLRIAVNDSADTYNWTNSSYFFKINERATGGVTVTFDTDAIINASEYYGTALKLNVTTNATIASCTFYRDNTSTTIGTIGNTSGKRTEYSNTSAVTFGAFGDNSWRYLDAKCSDTFGNASWSNVSVGSPIFQFKINEKKPDTVSISYDNNSVNIVNGTEYYITALKMNLTTNSTISTCTGYLDKGKQSFAMANNTGLRTVYSNSSLVSILSNGHDSWRRLSYSCADTFGNTSWSNSTAMGGYELMYKINEKSANSVSISSASNSLTNGTIYSSDQQLRYNITLNETLTACNVVVDDAVNATLTNQSGVRTRFWNNTAFTLDETANFGDLRKITYRCEDAYGNYSWYNASTTPSLYIIIDKTAPTLTFRSRTLGNYSISGEVGNYVNLTYNITEANPSNSYITIYYPNNTVKNKTATNMSLGQRSTVMVNITAGDVPINGKYQIETRHIDGANRAATSGVTNYTYIVNHIKSGNWTPISMFGNYTLKEIATLVPGITDISVFNHSGTKTFVSWTLGVDTNGLATVNSTLNSTWIKTNQDIVFIREYSAIQEQTNQTIDNTKLATGSRWGFLGVVSEKTLNQTLYSTAFINGSSAGYGLGSLDSRNITAIAWLNSTSGLMCSALRGFTITSCPGFTVADITPRVGEVIGILTQNNTMLAVNRTLI